VRFRVFRKDERGGAKWEVCLGTPGCWRRRKHCDKKWALLTLPFIADGKYLEADAVRGQ
jgi:hypothetical protein